MCGARSLSSWELRLVWAGEAWNLPWLVYADAIAGLGVAGVILWVGSQLGRRTLDALLDAAPEGLQMKSVGAVGQHGRSAGGGAGAGAAGRQPAFRGRHSKRGANREPGTGSLLTDAIEKRIGEIVPADVIVHAEPRAPRDEHLFESCEQWRNGMGLAVHDITAVDQDGQLFVELHLEVDENLSLRDAHRQATKLEEGIRELRDGKMDVNIHIEPLGRHIATPDTRAGEMRQLEMSVDPF